MKKFTLLLLLVVTSTVSAATFNLFSPANGVLKGDASTYITTSATSTDVKSLWTGTCDGTTYLRGDGTCATPPGTGGGTVNSVGLTAPSIFSVSGSPVTSSGTLGLTFATGQTANQILATPDGTTGAVGLRALVSGDLPTVPVAKGGSGAVTLTGLLKGNGTSAFTSAIAADVYGLWTGSCSASTFLRGDGSCATPTAGTGTVTSVALTVPSGFSVTGSPVTTSGTLAITGTLNPAAGGTGVATLTGIAKGNGTSAFTAAVSGDVRGLWGGTCDATTYLRGDGSCATPPTGGTSANPSATIGLTAVNGSAGTFLRSDGAPALSQAISPTWSGTHSFTGTATRGGTATRVSLGGTPGNTIIAMNNASAATDAKGTELQVSTTGTFSIFSVDEAVSANRTLLNAPRSGLGWSSLSFGNATDNPTYSFLGTGAISGVGSGLTALNASSLSSGTVPSARISGAYTGLTSVGAGFTVGTGASSAGLTINGAAATTRDLTFQTNGSNRWIARADGTAETGSNAGSNFALIARDDAGALLNTVMTATRSTGNVTFGANVTATGTVSGSNLSASGGANPSASIGLTATNGSAITYMRSDGSPALSQAISPTWTGTHKFTGTAGVDTTQKNVQLGSRSTLTSLIATNNAPATNAKAWEMQVSATGTLGWLTLDDGLTTGSYLLQATRSGSALSVVSFGNATDNPTYTFNGTGLTTLGGNLLVSGTAATVGNGASSAAQVLDGAAATTRSLNYYTAGSPRWVVRTNNTAESGSNAGSNFEIERRNDAGAALGTPLSINRSTGTVTIATPTSGNALTVSGTVAATAVTGDGSGLTALDAGDISAGTLPVARGGTGVTSSTGSGSVVLSTSPTLVTPVLGTPTSATLTNATGLPLTTGVTGILPAANGGTANGFTAFSGPATSTKTFTLPNASATILTDNAAVTAVQGGTGQTSYTTGDILYASDGTTLSKLAAGTSGQVLTSNGAGVAPSYQTAAITSSTGTFQLTMSSGCSTSTNVNFGYRKISSVVTIWIVSGSSVLCTSNSTTFVDLAGLPVDIRPASIKQVLAPITDNNTETWGKTHVTSAGALGLTKSGGFTASGSKGFVSGWSITYPTD